MVIVLLAVMVILAATMMLTSESVLLRVIYLKLMADTCALVLLGMGGPRDDGMLRALAVVVVVLGLGISFVFFISPKSETR